MRSPLRVGVLLDGLLQPAWVYRLVQQIQASSSAEIELIALAKRPRTPAGGFHQYLVYRLYTWLDDWLFQSRGDPLQHRSVAQLVTGVRLVRLGAARGELKQIAANDLDVVLDLAGQLAVDESVGLARFGVWTLHHGRDLATTGGPPGFWEVFEQDIATGSLLAVTDGAPPRRRVVYRSYAPTNQHSVRRSKSNYYPKTADFVMRKLAQLHAEGPTAIADSPPDEAPRSAERHSRPPDNAEMAGLLWRLGRRYVSEKASQLSSIDQWFVACSVDACGANARPGGRRFTYFLPPADRYWADPFPVRHGGQMYIFLEEYMLQHGRAHISVSLVDDHGRPQAPVRVLERPYHLSYPFVFEWQGNHYMLPETAKNRTIELYRATQFPFEWQLEQVLVDGLTAADATLTCVDERWWLFANVGVPGSDNSDELHLFHADSPLGPWRPHPRNPVKSDARSARPAGRILKWRGALYRPAQDCAGRYGRAIILNRITTLNTERYAETEVGRIEPDPAAGIFATHTLNTCGTFMCLDGVIRVPKKTARSGPRFAAGLAVVDEATDLPTLPGPVGFRLTGEAAALVTGDDVPVRSPAAALC